MNLKKRRHVSGINSAQTSSFPLQIQNPSKVNSQHCMRLTLKLWSRQIIPAQVLRLGRKQQQWLPQRELTTALARKDLKTNPSQLEVRKAPNVTIHVTARASEARRRRSDAPNGGTLGEEPNSPSGLINQVAIQLTKELDMRRIKDLPSVAGLREKMALYQSIPPSSLPKRLPLKRESRSVKPLS